MINLRSATDRKREWIAKTRLMRGFERAMSYRLTAEFERVARKAASAYLRDGHHAIEDAITGHDVNLQKIAIPVMTASGLAFGKRAIAQFRKSEGKDTESQMRERVAQMARRRARRSMAKVSATTKDKINRAIADGVQEGKSKDEIAKDIRARTSGKVGEARAKIIAQTEVHSASNAGEVESVKAMGVDVNKEWLSMGDDLVRPDHQEASGDQVSLDEAFDIGGDKLMFPGDPDGPPEQTINCRCILVYNDAR